MAVGAVMTGSLSFPQALGQFLLAVVGGVLIGGLGGIVLGWVRRRVRNPYTDVVMFLVAPFVAFPPAEQLGASGLVSVVVTGLHLGHRVTTIMEPRTRVVTGSVRTAVWCLLEGVVFLLVGLQLRTVLAGVAQYPPGTVLLAAVAVVATLLVVRFAWILLSEQALPTVIRRRQATWSESTRTAWAGMWGAVSLAAVLTLPTVLGDGRAFPGVTRSSISSASGFTTASATPGNRSTTPTPTRTPPIPPPRSRDPTTPTSPPETPTAATSRGS